MMLQARLSLPTEFLLPHIVHHFKAYPAVVLYTHSIMGKREEGRSEWSAMLELGPRQEGVPDAGSDKEGAPDTAQQPPPRRRFGDGLVATRQRDPSAAFSTFSPLPLRQQCTECKDKDLIISQLRKELENAEVGRERFARMSKELEAAKKDCNILSGEVAAVNKMLLDRSAETADTATMLQVVLGEHDVQVQQGYIYPTRDIVVHDS